MPLVVARRRLLALSAALLVARPRRARAQSPTVASLKAAGRIRIGVAPSYPPFSSRDEKGALVGYDVDLARLIWGPDGITPEFVETPWGGVIDALFARKFDLIMTGISYTPERVKQVIFSIPYAAAGQVLMIRAADAKTFRRVEDVNDKVVGILLGSVGERLHAQIAEQKHLSYREVRKYVLNRDARAALEQGKIDALFTGSAAASVEVAVAPGKFAVVSGLGVESWSGMAARPDDTELIDYVNRRLRALKADDRLFKLQEKWFGFRMPLIDQGPSAID